MKKNPCILLETKDFSINIFQSLLYTHVLIIFFSFWHKARHYNGRVYMIEITPLHTYTHFIDSAGKQDDLVEIKHSIKKKRHHKIF